MNPMTGSSGCFRLILGKQIDVLEFFSSVMLMIMMLLTFVDVVGRYIFSKPIFGATEMISALLAMVFFSGLGIANARDRHIVVELFDTQLQSLAPRFFNVVIQGFSVLAMSLIAWVLFELVLDAYQDDGRTIVLELPLIYIIGTISALAIVSVISQILGLLLKRDDSRDQHQGRAGQ